MHGLDPIQILVSFAVILISLTIHEFAHAWVANYMGDPTPGRHDRLNLNPMTIIQAHPFGALIVPLIGASQGFLIGWAATPVNPHLVDRKYSLRQAEWWISIAGPLSNGLLAILFAFVLAGVLLMGPDMGDGPHWGREVLRLASAFVTANVFLMLFNLIPVPPFDGFTILANSLPRNQQGLIQSIEQYGNILILGVFILGGRVLSPLIFGISDFLIKQAISILSIFV